MYINKAMIYGNLTRNPEMRALPSGMQVCSFSVATNRTYNDRDGKRQEAVEYHNVVAFGKQAEVISKYLVKGRPVYVEGRMQTSSWDKDGQKHYRTEIVMDRFEFGPSTGAASAAPSAAQASALGSSAPVLPDYPVEDINPEDIPF